MSEHSEKVPKPGIGTGLALTENKGADTIG